ncbi:MAG: phosphoribosyl-AMP cyclohydrolase [Candidatus Glassbacteria bacterium]|nr:phosphoribosyl-AMP cyclohydrolase [Candidatus Glassbacteria bacterium]
MSDYGQLLDRVKFDDKGLLSAVAQDAETGEVLMLAFMNREALEQTLQRRVACYWSRSRGKLWVKGETSGHIQHIDEITIDCDMDVVVLKVRQQGGACHTGYRSCFYRRVEEDGSLTVTGEKVFDEDDVYGKK